MKMKVLILLLVLGTVSLNASDACKRGLLPGLERCPVYFQQVQQQIHRGTLPSAMTANAYAKLWANCFNYRDFAEARQLSILIKPRSPFWAMLFQRLAGENVDAAKALRAAQDTDVPSTHYALILVMLFTPDELTHSGNALLANIGERAKQELGSWCLPCRAPSKTTGDLPISRGFGEGDFQYLFPFQGAILAGGLDSGCLQAITMAAFLSCHLKVASAGYDRIKHLVEAIPPRYRGAGSLGFDFALLAYYSGKSVRRTAKPNWVIADGVELPASALVTKLIPSPQEAYGAEITRLVQMTAERMRMGL